MFKRKSHKSVGGLGGLMWMVSVIDVLPSKFLATTVNVPDAKLVGVPEIRPLTESKLKPGGNCGVTL
jgi:hypothetical protein